MSGDQTLLCSLPRIPQGIVCFDACYESHFRVEEIKDFGACVRAPSEVAVQEFCRRGREEVFNSEKAFLYSRASDGCADQC